MVRSTFRRVRSKLQAAERESTVRDRFNLRDKTPRFNAMLVVFVTCAAYSRMRRPYSMSLHRALTPSSPKRIPLTSNLLCAGSSASKCCALTTAAPLATPAHIDR
eukprot:COSAG01_NODE_3374_length_6176_cov_14.095904_7_plen_105_part_00